MKASTKKEIEEAIKELNNLGGKKDTKIAEVVDKLEKAIEDEEKSKE